MTKKLLFSFCTTAIFSFAKAAAVATTTLPAAANASPVSPSGTAACPTPAALNLDLTTGMPANWETASLVAGDTVAQNLYNSMLANDTFKTVLAVAPKKFGAGGVPDATGYPATDPDCWWTYNLCVTPKQPFLPPDVSTCQEARTWGLTVDDGPLPAHCHLYELYKEHNIHASLFYIGSNVQQYGASALEGFNAGHHICVHTWSHNYTTSLTNEEVFAELYYTKLIIKRVTGYTPRCWRPPYGDIDDRVRSIGQYLDLFAVLWDQDTDDWQLSPNNSTADGDVPQTVIQQNFNNILGNVSDLHGTIVLDHELSVDIANMWIINYPAISSTYKNIIAGLTCNNITAPWAESGAPIYNDFNGELAGNVITIPPPVSNATAQILLAVGQSYNPAPPSTITSNSSNPLSPGAISTGPSNTGSGNSNSNVNRPSGSDASSFIPSRLGSLIGLLCAVYFLL